MHVILVVVIIVVGLLVFVRHVLTLRGLPLDAGEVRVLRVLMRRGDDGVEGTAAWRNVMSLPAGSGEVPLLMSKGEGVATAAHCVAHSSELIDVICTSSHGVHGSGMWMHASRPAAIGEPSSCENNMGVTLSAGTAVGPGRVAMGGPDAGVAVCGLTLASITSSGLGTKPEKKRPKASAHESSGSGAMLL